MGCTVGRAARQHPTWPEKALRRGQFREQCAIGCNQRRRRSKGAKISQRRELRETGQLGSKALRLLAATGGSWEQRLGTATSCGAASHQSGKLGSRMGIGVSVEFIKCIHCKVGLASSRCFSRLQSNKQAVFWAMAPCRDSLRGRQVEFSSAPGSSQAHTSKRDEAVGQRQQRGNWVASKLTFKRPQNNRKSLDNIRNTHKGKLAVALTEGRGRKRCGSERRKVARGSG